MECEECLTTDCSELKLEGDFWVCCNHSDVDYDLYEMCDGCHVDYISSEADMYKDMVNDDLVLGDDN